MATVFRLWNVHGIGAERTLSLTLSVDNDAYHSISRKSIEP